MCVCGARLLWVPYLSKVATADLDQPRRVETASLLPLDRVPARPGDPEYWKASYAVLEGKTQCRLITESRPLDESIESPHHIHYATCTQQVTAEQLAAMTQRTRKHR